MIIKQFEEQVEKFPFNTAVKAGNKSLTYNQLDQYANQVAGEIIANDKKDANNVGQSVALLFEHGIHMIAGLIGALKAGKLYVPMEITYPVKRLTYMLEDSGSTLILTSSEYFPLARHLTRQIHRRIDILNIENINIENKNNNNPNVDNYSSEMPGTSRKQQVSRDKPAYIIYTSGSTGWPKGVVQTHRNVLYYIRHWVQRFSITGSDRLTMVSAFCHDGAVPDIFSSLLTGACLYPYSLRTSTSPDGLYNMLTREEITVWHSVPSLFRHFAETLTAKGCFPHIRWVVLGGEPLRSHDLELFKTYFPNATLANIYGQTESTVNSICFISRDDTFDNVSIGEPLEETGIFLVNKDGDIIEDMGVGEIVVASDYIAPGYWRDEEKSAEVFLYDRDLGKLYRTGDIGRLTGGGAIKIMGRQDQQVKIRGFRIELGEIESQLLTIKNIEAAVVIARQGDNNNIEDNDQYLCAYISARANKTGPIDQSRLRDHLADSLPDYMIPSYFVQLEQLPLLPNGKIDRKALPAPELETGDDYKAPRNDIEKKLVDIWSRLLGIEKNKISIDDNFFLLGGHSLKATVLLSRVHKELKVEVPLSVLFKKPQIRELAAYIVNQKATIYHNIIPVEMKEYYPQSAAQKRLFFLDRFDHLSTSYNMPAALVTEDKIQQEKAQHALQALIHRHQTLRTSFEFVDAQPVQRVHRDIKFQIKEDQADNETEIPWKIKKFMRPFPLNTAPLLRMELLALPDNRHLILLDMHHIIVDGTSQAILVSEFCHLYTGEELPPLKIQYKDFSTWQNQLFKDGKISESRQYWMNLYPDTGQIPRLSLPTDFPRPPLFIFEGDIHTFQFSPAQTLGIKGIGNQWEATLFMSLLALINVLLYKYTGQEDMIVGCNVAGRPHADLQGIIGMFVNELAIRNYPGGKKSFVEFLKEIRESSISAFEHQDYQFEQLVDQLNIEKDLSRNPLFDVEFAFQNYDMSTAVIPRLSMQSYPYTNKTSQFDLALYAHEKEDQIYCHFRYCTRLFKRRTIEAMTRHFHTILSQVIQKPGILLSDIVMISPEEKRQILFEFNSGPKKTQPGECYPALFQRQVKETPDRIAVRYKNESVSYGQLETKAGGIAGYLYHGQRIKTNDRVGIWMERSIDYLAAILGIMEAGAAYVPIEPSYPPERLKRIIDDAGIRVIISQKKHLRDLGRCQWESRVFDTFIIIDSELEEYRVEDDMFELDATRKLWNYVVKNATDEITGGGWLTGNTGKPFTPEEMEEYGNNVLKKLQPLLGKDMRVLEIGCASGITMYRIAPLVGVYYGTDISNASIAANKRRVKKNKHHNIFLHCLPAHEIDKLAEQNFDLVIINSSIQSFPSHDYFKEVVRKSVERLTEKGHIFIGDVLDQDLKQNLIQEMIDFQQVNPSKENKTKVDWSKELFFTREFFQDLVLEIPGIRRVEFSAKIHTIENELTKYRYDSLLTIDKTAGNWSNRPEPKRHKYRHDLRHLHDNGGLGRGPGAVVAPDNFAYIIYTSGTTGQPKGVVIHQAGMTNHILAKINDLSITGEDMVAQTASASFDISVWQFLAGLLAGASIVIFDKETILESKKFLKLLQREKISILESVPSLMSVFLETTQQEKDNRLKQLRWMIPTGETLPVSLVRRWYERYPDIKLLNAYGPTEASDDVTHYIINEIPPREQTTIPIGKPLPNLHIYILDKNLSLCPFGIRGEICVAGIGVGKGYWGDESKTGQSFIPNPYLEDIGDNIYATIYKTGDYGYFREDGNIECLGRMDHQVKIMGNRIELGEIENQLLKHGSVKDVVVTMVKGNEEKGGSNKKENKYICAYYVLKKRTEEIDLRGYLLKELPDYMIPNYFIPLEELPLSSTGKVDRKALPEPAVSGVGDKGGEYIAPGDEIEKKLVRIWSEMLGLEEGKISATSNFFEIGGHSLSAITLISQIHSEFGVELPLTSLFKTPILREIAGQIKLVSCAEDPVLLLNPSDSLSGKIIFCLPPGIGFGLAYKTLSLILKGYLLYSFNFIESEDRLNQYCEMIMGIQKTGPYVLFGYSASGPLMLELGKQLENKGQEVSDIIFLDCIFAGKDKNTQGVVKKLNEKVARNLEEKLIDMGIGFLKDKILKKNRKYMAYEENITNLEVVNANIHLILSEETWDTPLSSCWDKFTTGKSLVYQGFGCHRNMLDPGILEKNAQIIQEILDKINAESSY